MFHLGPGSVRFVSAGIGSWSVEEETQRVSVIGGALSGLPVLLLRTPSECGKQVTSVDKQPSGLQVSS